MLRRLLNLTVVLALSQGVAALAAPRLKVLKLAVTNPGTAPRLSENIVLSVAELKKIAPDFSPSSAILVCTDTATVEDDARVLQTTELVSQADDIDGDRTLDEIAFQIPLQPGQTKIVTIAYGEAQTIARLRVNHPARTYAKFTMKFDGPAWESEETAWRLYFDKRNAIDLYGKRRPGLYLDLFATPEYVYHAESPLARDIYLIGKGLGIGSVGALVNGRPEGVADVADRQYRIVATGPVRAIVEITYKDWKIGGRAVNLVSRFTQWAGERGFDHQVTAKGAEGLTLVATLPKKPGTADLNRPLDGAADVRVVTTWGPQVVEQGTNAGTRDLPNENLGLALLVFGTGDGKAGAAQPDPANHLVPV
ncbi:MAG: DUF4861 domain-containing protein, partial [Acidobacteriales bacterium]